MDDLSSLVSDEDEIRSLLWLQPAEGIKEAQSIAQRWAAEAASEIGIKQADKLHAVLEALSDPADRRDLLRAALVEHERVLRYTLVLHAFALLKLDEPKTAEDLFVLAGGGNV